MEDLGAPPDTVLAADIVEVAAAGPRRTMPPARGPAARPMAKWEAGARDRVRAAIGRYTRPLADLVARDADEADTRRLVTGFLRDGLGYRQHGDLTTEYQVSGEFTGYGVRAAGRPAAFIEIKQATTRLGAKHLRQAGTCAVSEGAGWIILTNGPVWQAWHLTPDVPWAGTTRPSRPTPCSTCPKRRSGITSSTGCGAPGPPPPPRPSGPSSPVAP